jgi:hypothetical protein
MSSANSTLTLFSVASVLDETSFFPELAHEEINAIIIANENILLIIADLV